MLSELRAETALQIKKAALANAAPPVDIKPLEERIEFVKAALLKRLDLHEKSIQDEHIDVVSYRFLKERGSRFSSKNRFNGETTKTESAL